MAGNQDVVKGLNGLLADGSVFYQKLRHYHWNVVGREFFTLHVKFEELYTAWALHIDAVAERILMLGGTPLHTMASLLKHATLSEDESIPAAPAMVEALTADLGVLRERMQGVIDAAEGTGDRGTANLLDGLADALEKDVWMLEAWSKEAAQSWS